ncbi:hypothetical protein TNCV_1787141 [Trichonephila clavipes]|nr:hypothetical protein TNCV_1787141 [Trichonephila clavipes]
MSDTCSSVSESIFAIKSENFVSPLAVVLAPDEGCVETSWKSAGGTDADTAIGNAEVQMLVKLLELERLLELDHVTALVLLSLLLTISESPFEVKYIPPTKVTRDV